jgi:hypothetical protein
MRLLGDLVAVGRPGIRRDRVIGDPLFGVREDGLNRPLCERKVGDAVLLGIAAGGVIRRGEADGDHLAGRGEEVAGEATSAG